MKQYIQTLIDKTYKELNTVNSKEKLSALTNNLNELLFIQNSLNNDKSQIINRINAIGLSIQNIDVNFYNFVKQIVELYASIPHLDTESYISYPMLSSTAKMTYSYMHSFWNNLYSKEHPKSKNLVFLKENYEIFEKNRIKAFFCASGHCMIFHDHTLKQNKLLLDRHYTVRDLIIPCGKGIELIEEVPFAKYNNSVRIMEYYMRDRAVQQLAQSQYEKESNKLNLLHTDFLVSEARYLKQYINKEWSELSHLLRGYFLAFIDEVIGYALAKNSNIKLDDIIKYITESTVEQDLNFTNLGTSNDKIIYDTKNLAKILCKKTIKK